MKEKNMTTCRHCKIEIESGQFCEECKARIVKDVFHNNLDFWKLFGLLGGTLLGFIDGVSIKDGNLIIKKDSKIGEYFSKARELYDKIKKEQDGND